MNIKSVSQNYLNETATFIYIFEKSGYTLLNTFIKITPVTILALKIHLIVKVETPCHYLARVDFPLLHIH